MTVNLLHSYFLSSLAEEHLATQTVIGRDGIPSLRFGTGSAIWGEYEIATRNLLLRLCSGQAQITQKLKVKNKSDKSKPKNVVRGFSLVQWQDCTTLKGRTTTVFGL